MGVSVMILFGLPWLATSLPAQETGDEQQPPRVVGGVQRCDRTQQHATGEAPHDVRRERADKRLSAQRDGPRRESEPQHTARRAAECDQPDLLQCVHDRLQ
jgi:hypothetical protein